jgi:hypothetical protein
MRDFIALICIFFQPQQPPRKAMCIYETNDGINRKWLTCCKKDNSLFCSVCFAYAKPSAPFGNVHP